MTEDENLKEKLFNKKVCGWEGLQQDEKEIINVFSDEYMYFLNKAKTEREAAIFCREVLEKNGFVDLRQKMTIEAEESIAWTLDGEFGGDYKSVIVENHMRALDIVIDKAAYEEMYTEEEMS